MVVSQSARVQQHPPLLRAGDGAVVADEVASAALIVDPDLVEGHVDSVGGAVVVRLEQGLLVRAIPDDKVHHGLRRLQGLRGLTKRSN